MSDNLEIWNKLGKTDPKHTKGFKRAGGFGGTAIKPIYTEQKMTEVFGPAGKGWGMGEPMFQTVPGSDGQVAVFCTVELWWAEERKTDPSFAAANLYASAGTSYGPPNRVYGVGGDMVVVKQSAGLRTDDEAFKKAFTDAVGNAMKHLGMSADVHMGLFDDSKYVQEREREERAVAAPTVAGNGSVAVSAPDHLEAALGPSMVPAEVLPVPAVGGLKNTAQRNLWGRIVAATRACQSWEQFNTLWDHSSTMAAYDGFSQDWKNEMDNEVNDKSSELTQKFGKFIIKPNFDKMEVGE